MPAALRNTLARGLWRAGCWLQLAAWRLEVAGPATAPLGPATEDAWQPSPPGLSWPVRPARGPGRDPAYGPVRGEASGPASNPAGGPPAHWQRLLDGRDPRQLHAGTPRAGGAGNGGGGSSGGKSGGGGSSAAGQPRRGQQPPATRRPPASEHRQAEPTAERHPAQPSAQRRPAEPATQPRPALTLDQAHLVGQGTILHPDLPRHFVRKDRSLASQVGVEGPQGRAGRWPSLPDDTPLWRPEWPDPARDRAARLDEEQRGTPWSG
jgi:hypothetical protein